MILFVFEGKKREPDLFKTIQQLYFPKDNNQILCSFGNNIYDLYKEVESLKINGEDYSDIVSLLKRKNKKDSALANVNSSSDFSEIYLFFDYDFQEKYISIEEINVRVKEMLSLFDNETENGKLYINYPMVESIRYTKKLPDDDYYSYVVSRADCHNFKNLATHFSAYSSLDFILINSKSSNMDKVKYNWDLLKMQNTKKANYICSGNNFLPEKNDCISQQYIFDNQLNKYVLTNDSVAVLNAFPLFLYEYFGI